MKGCGAPPFLRGEERDDRAKAVARAQEASSDASGGTRKCSVDHVTPGLVALKMQGTNNSTNKMTGPIVAGALNFNLQQQVTRNSIIINN